TSAGNPSSSSEPPTAAARATAAVRRDVDSVVAAAAISSRSAASSRSRRALLIETAEPLELEGRPFAVGDDLGLVVAVAALEREDLAKTRLERGDRHGVVLDVVGQSADLRGRVVELGLETGQAFGRGLEARVETGERAGLARSDRDRLPCARFVGGERLVDCG